MVCLLSRCLRDKDETCRSIAATLPAFASSHFGLKEMLPCARAHLLVTTLRRPLVQQRFSQLSHGIFISSNKNYRRGISCRNMYTKSENGQEGNSLMSAIVDLRSDTLTKPSLEMRQAMFDAKVGDDVLGEDPTINHLQATMAELLGKEAALFLPSGTMSNLIAVMTHCHSRGDKVLIGDKSHILQHEDGGVSELGGIMINTIPNNPDGTFDLDLMERSWFGSIGGNVSLVCIENTFGHGGSVLPLEFLDEIGTRLRGRKTPLHVDGARLFNAAVYLKVPASRLVKDCTSVSVCLSKGLGAPIGSLLVGSSDFIRRAHRLRHLVGGAMRQVGVLGAPGLVALQTGVDRLVEDHENMFKLASAIANMKSSCLSLNLDLVHTNIAIIRINPKCCTAGEMVKRLDTVTEEEKAALEASIQIKCYAIGFQEIRFVTWNAITDADIDRAIRKIVFINKELEENMKT